MCKCKRPLRRVAGKAAESARRFYANRSYTDQEKTVYLDFNKYVPETKEMYIKGMVRYKMLKYYELDRKEGIDFVVCPYCGCRMSSLNAKHLKQHNKTVSDIKKEFGENYQVVAQTTHDKRSVTSREAQNRLVASGEHIGWQSRKIRSYAEIFWENVLDNNKIKYSPNYMVKKRELGVEDNSNYFLDFFN